MALQLSRPSVRKYKGDNSMTVLYLCGAGNSEGVRIAHRINEVHRRWDRIILLDDDPAKHGKSILGVEIMGPLSMLGQADSNSSEVANLVARTSARRWVVRRKLEKYGLPFATMINPNVDVEGAEIGNDVIVYGNATIGPQVSIGDCSVVFMGGVIGHESQLGRGCIVAANAVLNARVQLGDGVYVGTNATILPEVKVGKWATIGAGSVVMHDVPVGATVMGVPAKTLMTLDIKLKLCRAEALPEDVRIELAGQIRESPSARRVHGVDHPGIGGFAGR
jgi:sugar O-acyltransferase (sialic acid O-acetyltransferase NeuD family)